MVKHFALPERAPSILVITFCTVLPGGSPGTAHVRIRFVGITKSAAIVLGNGAVILAMPGGMPLTFGHGTWSAGLGVTGTIVLPPSRFGNTEVVVIGLRVDAPLR